MRYWLNVSSLKSWEAEERAGRYMLGASKKWLGLVSKIQPGDLIAEYLSGESHSFVAVFRATSRVYEDRTTFWPHALYPYRVDREPVLLKPEGSIGALGRVLGRQLSFVRDKSHWGSFFQLKVRELPREDLLVIWNSLARKGAIEKVPLSKLETREAAGASRIISPRSDKAKHVEEETAESAGGVLYSHYRELGLDHIEARLMECAHELMSPAPPGPGDLVDAHVALGFVLNELSQSSPRGWVGEELQRLETRRIDLVVKWAQASTLAKLVDLARLADLLRDSGSYPAGRMAGKSPEP